MTMVVSSLMMIGGEEGRTVRPPKRCVCAEPPPTAGATIIRGILPVTAWKKCEQVHECTEIGGRAGIGGSLGGGS